MPPLNDRLGAVLDWLRAGYPAGVPPTDYIPLLALLRRRLSEDEVAELAAELGSQTDGLPSSEDIGVRITTITDALPSAEDVARVEAELLRVTGRPAP